MKVLKGFALGLLGFLLYISLSTFGLVYMLNSTLLNPDFVAAEVAKLDIAAAVSPLIKDYARAQIPAQFVNFATPVIDATLVELKPWINQQANSAIKSGYDYILGKTPEMRITLQLDPAKEIVRNNLRKAISQSPPPELQQLPPALRDQLLNQVEQQLFSQIPSTYTVDRSVLGKEGADALQQARQIVGNVQTVYTWLIILIVVLAIGIALIHRRVRGATRQLGITFLTCGILELAGYFALSSVVPGLLPQMGDLPPALQAWLPQVISDFMAPLLTYSIALVVVGVILLVVFFVYPKRRPAEVAA